jgi:multiple sugar transport system permease protein
LPAAIIPGGFPRDKEQAMIKIWTEKHIHDLMVLPLMIFLLLMVAFPLAYTIYLSFTEWSMGTTPPLFIGIENYKDILTEPDFWNATKHTLYIAFGSVAVEMLLGTGIALVLNRPFRGKNLVKTLFLLPMVATPIAVGMVWQLIYEPTLGIANHFLKMLHISPVLWLVNKNLVLNSIILIEVWEWTPMVMLIVLAGLAGIPNEIYESGKVDGAGPIKLTTRITLPMLTPTLVITALLRIIDALKTFDIIFATTQGGPLQASETVNLLAYRSIFNYFKMGHGAALLLCFLIEIGLCCALIVILRRKVREKLS